jgi:hypothetical protein
MFIDRILLRFSTERSYSFPSLSYNETNNKQYMKEQVNYGVFLLQKDATRSSQISAAQLKSLPQALKTNMMNTFRMIQKPSLIVRIRKTKTKMSEIFLSNFKMYF